jgi:hypothetical protein
MATHQISLLNGSVAPDNTGRATVEPADINQGANDVWKYLLWLFASPSGTQAHGIYGVFTLPQNYLAGATLIVLWNSTATTGNVRHRFTYRAVGGDDAESLDQTTNQESVNGVDTVASTARERMVQTLALTAGNFLAGDTVQWFFERWDDGSNLDTMAANSYLHDLLFQYSD